MEKEEIIQRYEKSLTTHIKYVREAGELLGVPEEQLAIHDASKRSKEEYEAYAIHFQGGGTEPKRFAMAWLHHIHNNPHHWQYWMFCDGYKLKDSGIHNGTLPMPSNYVLEMVADWMGSSMAYTKSWDMTEWLNNNFYKIKLHPLTAGYLDGVLRTLGYTNYIKPFTEGG